MFVKGIGYCIASIWLLLLAATNANPSKDGRIVGGKLATVEQIPYIVQISVKGDFSCGGSLVARQYVVSAAHCFVNVEAHEVKVAVGFTRLSDVTEWNEVERITSFKDFDDLVMNNDVAVLKMKRPVIGDNFSFIELYSGDLEIGMDVVVSGWGLVDEKHYKPSDHLKTVTVQITDRKNCATAYRPIGYTVTENMFCASKQAEGEHEREDACTGDSGGPAVIDGQLAGIVSFGYGCAREAYPGVYTNVKQVTQFVKDCLKS